MMFELVVFDLDGTLIDSRRDLADSANALIAEYGGLGPLDEAAIVGMVGEGVQLLVQRALAAAGLPDVPSDVAAERFMALYGERLLRETRPYPGVRETLALAAERVPLALLSNKPRAESRAIVEGLDLAGFFIDVYGGDAPYPRKPDPSGLWALSSRAGASPASTLLVGDSPIDLDTARAAGVPVCLARYGFGFAKITPSMLTGEERFIDRPEDLIPILDAR
jgi:phosphoglycolate phosphatase